MSRPYAVRHLGPLGSPHIHIHYLIDDKGGDRFGYGNAHIVCHACNVATDILYDYPRGGPRAESEELIELRNAFVARHRHPLRRVQRALGASLCPPKYVVDKHLDIRRYGRWTAPLRWLRIR